MAKCRRRHNASERQYTVRTCQISTQMMNLRAAATMLSASVSMASGDMIDERHCDNRIPAFWLFGPTRCIHQFEIYARIFVAGEFDRGFVAVDALQLNGLGN